MNREILFRGQRVDNKELVYGYVFPVVINEVLRYFIIPCDTYCPKHITIKELQVEVIPETVGQYTGLTDKKGVKIFENDIVRWDDETNGEKWRVAVVEFNPDIQFRIIRIECDFIQSAKEGYVFGFWNFAYKDTHNHLEKIGNIHDNENRTN